jgi:TonB family protein
MVKRKCGALILVCAFALIAISSSHSQTDGSVAKGPTLISKPDLSFPSIAYAGRVAGSIWVRVLISETGMPIKTAIERRDPEMAYLFDDEARKWAMGCRFSPARDVNGDPVAVWQVIPLSFKFDDYTPPECLAKVEPEYPEEALAMGMEGWVGVAVLVKSNGEPDLSQILVVGREPSNTTVFDRAARDAAFHCRYRAAGYRANSIEGWCFIKIPFVIRPDRSRAGDVHR